MTATPSLARTIEHLKAKEIAPGRYVFPMTHPRKGRRFWTTDADGLRAFQGGESADHIAKPMPSWWTLENREICQCENERVAWSQCTNIDAHLPRRITADLESGAEIPA